MITNNNEPSVVTSLRRAKRIVKCGSKAARYYKTKAHRNWRRTLRKNMRDVIKGKVSPDEFNDSRKRSCMATGWDIC